LLSSLTWDPVTRTTSSAVLSIVFICYRDDDYDVTVDALIVDSFLAICYRLFSTKYNKCAAKRPKRKTFTRWNNRQVIHLWQRQNLIIINILRWWLMNNKRRWNTYFLHAYSDIHNVMVCLYSGGK
jgi:hypothetical protein